MAKQTKRLDALTVKALSTPGRYSDGDNLYLAIGKNGSKRWAFIYMLDGRQREGGLGSAATVTLAHARAKAHEWRSMISKGINPIDAKRAAGGARIAPAAVKTFGDAVEALIAAKGAAWRSHKYRKQWQSTLISHAPSLLDLPVADVDAAHIISALGRVWSRAPETASRLRGRIESVLSFAAANRWRAGDNPAIWRGHLEHVFPPRSARPHHRAMAYAAVPKFVASLVSKDSLPALALQFVILTATRTSEALHAEWTEIDVEARVWTIPPSRMKAGKEHRIPLSDRAIEILADLAAVRSGPFVFPGQRTGRPLSRPRGVALANAEGVSVHGFRSTFRDWVGEETDFPREVAEAALAHSVGNAVETAYRRGDALEKRRALMQAWADFCTGRSDR
ncbi:MAG: integrase arm-type DNA-binding domain-containing protein [Methylocella sp.]